MGYFSNGTEGADYEERWCSRCVHYDRPDDDHFCPILQAHGLYNYRDANDDHSVLHMLIPRSKDGLSNEQCAMFYEKAADGDLFADPAL